MQWNIMVIERRLSQKRKETGEGKRVEEDIRLPNFVDSSISHLSFLEH